MTDSERLAEIRKSRATINAPKRPPYPEGPEDFLLRLLDTTRSERDAALARADRCEAVIEAARKIAPELQAMYDGQDRERREKGYIGSGHRDRFENWVENLSEALAALTPPAYPL